ncbi:MAG: hypothetical protein LBT16_06080 [Treponema sp.]|nr:hypothetical protein [Treponema sp.]
MSIFSNRPEETIPRTRQMSDASAQAITGYAEAKLSPISLTSSSKD